MLVDRKHYYIQRRIVESDLASNESGFCINPTVIDPSVDRILRDYFRTGLRQPRN